MYMKNGCQITLDEENNTVEVYTRIPDKKEPKKYKEHKVIVS